MLFVIDNTTSVEIIYNEKEESYTRKIRKNGIVVDIAIIDKAQVKNYFSTAELEMFDREYKKWKEKRNATKE